MMNTPLPLLVLALAFVLGGCSNIQRTTSNSYQDKLTNIAPDEAVSIVLNRYSQCKENNQSAGPGGFYADGSHQGSDCIDSSSESNEQGLERCVTNSLLKHRDKRDRSLEGPKLNILPTKEFRRIAFPDKEFAASPRTTDAIIEALGNNEFKQRINAVHLRYLIILDAQTTSETKTEGDLVGNQGWWAIAKTWKKTSTITATVVDMRNGVQSGVATGESWGKSATGALVYVIVPIIPFFSLAPTESEACNELGQELGEKFFTTPTVMQPTN